MIRDEAKAKAPVFTGKVSQGHPPPGTLRRAIALGRSNRFSGPGKEVYHVFVRNAATSTKGRKVAAGGKFDAYYWRYVEFGTSRMAARPFLRPAFEVKKKKPSERLPNTSPTVFRKKPRSSAGGTSSHEPANHPAGRARRNRRRWRLEPSRSAEHRAAAVHRLAARDFDHQQQPARGIGRAEHARADRRLCHQLHRRRCAGRGDRGSRRRHRSNQDQRAGFFEDDTRLYRVSQDFSLWTT